MAAAAAALTPSPFIAQEATTSEIRLECTLHGPDVNQGLGFAPGAKVGYDFTQAISEGLEYYAGYGRIGPTAGTDHLLVKGILGRRFSWGSHQAVE